MAALESAANNERGNRINSTQLTIPRNADFALSRCVHHRVPNSASSRATDTENEYPGNSWRKILSARRVWNSDVTIKIRRPLSDARHFSASCDSSRVESPSMGQIRIDDA